MRLILLLLTILISAVCSYSQELKVVEFRKENSTINIGVQKKDLNGQLCALIKVQLPIAGVKFEGNVIDSKYDINEYLIFMSPNSKKLSIKCPQTKPLYINFTDVSAIEKLEPKGVYILELELSADGSTHADSELLALEYKEIVENANQCFRTKNFAEARSNYDKAIAPKYANLYDINSFRWIGLCDTIIKAQSKYHAITPQLAASFKNLSALTSETQGFSNGVIVVDHNYGNTSLIQSDGKTVTLRDAFVQLPGVFDNERLAVNLNGSPCFINKEGEVVLNYRKSNYNELFKDLNLKFSPFRNGYSVVYDSRKNGRHGIINEYGNTILPLTGKYEKIIILDWMIILYDKKSIFKWTLPNQNGQVLNKKHIFKLTGYDGNIYNINEDYILICDFDKNKITIYPFKGNNIYSIEGKWAKQGDRDNIIYEKGWKEYYVYNFRNGNTWKLSSPGVVSDGCVFDGKDCFDFDGNILFSLEERVEPSNAGFTNGVMLVHKGEEFWYIDRKGQKLVNSSFKVTDKKIKSKLLYAKKPFGDDFGLLVRNGEWGLIDRFGTTTFDYQ